MDLDSTTHKAVFKRRTKRLGEPLGTKSLNEPDYHQPPEKKPSIESANELDLLSQGDLSSCNEESDVDVFSLETPRGNSQSLTTEDREDQEEAEESIMKLGRQLQFREAKISDLNQKKDKLMEELRRIKLCSRDS